MVGRGLKTDRGEDETLMEMHEVDEEKQEASEGEHEHSGMQGAHGGAFKGFKRDFFEGVSVVARTEEGSEFMRVPGHGAMLMLKPEGRATLTFGVPADHKGEWQMACFVPGHYEAKMKGKVIVN